MAELAFNTYGKTDVRLTYVDRTSPRHEVRELNVSVFFEGDFTDTYLTGSNTSVLPTDTMKNTVYVLARQLRWSDIESPRNSTSAKGPTGSTTLALASRRRACAPSPSAPGLLSALKVWKLACPKGPADLVFPSRTGGVEHHRLMSSGLHAVIAAVGLTDQHGEPKYGLHAPSGTISPHGASILRTVEAENCPLRSFRASWGTPPSG